MRTQHGGPDDGATAAEYAILAAAIAAVVAAVVFGLGILTAGLYDSGSTCIATPTAPACR